MIRFIFWNAAPHFVGQQSELGSGMKSGPTRRQFVGSAALFGLTAVAGCLSTAESTADESTTSDASATDSPQQSPPESLEEWLSDANGYDGDIRRHSPQSRPRIRVGHSTDDGIAFAPAAIEVAPMTKVTWDWSGVGGQHNVVALDGTFDSGRTNAQDGTCYEYLFEEPGEYRFVSEPHRDEGMKGAIVVKEPPATGNEMVDEWVVDSSNFDGNIVDQRGSSSATITVGAEGNGGQFAFDPPVLKISEDTTVTWEWTGNGGPHNIVFKDLDLSSSELTHDPDAEFEHTFKETGTYRYACAPHKGLGMKGAIIVE